MFQTLALSEMGKKLTEMEHLRFLWDFVEKWMLPWDLALLFALLTSHNLEPAQKHNSLLALL